MAKGDVVAKRIRLGRRTELPLFALGGYVLSGPILFMAGVLDLSSAMRAPLLIAAVIAFLVGAVAHILDKIDRHDRAMVRKIDDSVGDVYDAGGKAKERQMNLAAANDRQLAVVRDLGPR